MYCLIKKIKKRERAGRKRGVFGVQLETEEAVECCAVVSTLGMQEILGSLGENPQSVKHEHLEV